MTIEHVDVTDPEIHEPVGASTATVGQVYIADGAGSGTWDLISAEDGTNTGGNGQQYRSNGAGGGSWVTDKAYANLSLGGATDNATATTLTAQDTWYPVGGTWVEVAAQDLTTATADGTIEIVTAGTYEFYATISIIASTGGDTFNFAFLVDGAYVAATARTRRKIGTGSDVGACSLHAIIPGLTAAQEIQIGAAALTAEAGDAPPAGTTVTIENASFRGDLLLAS